MIICGTAYSLNLGTCHSNKFSEKIKSFTKIMNKLDRGSIRLSLRDGVSSPPEIGRQVEGTVQRYSYSLNFVGPLLHALKYW